MAQLQGKERDKIINSMANMAVKQLNISKEQALKRVNALMEQPFITETEDKGPEDEMHALFIQVKTEQFMRQNID